LGTRVLAYVKGKSTVPNRAFGHTKEKDRSMESDQSATSATLGDGGVYSNLDDLSKWDAALENHSLLNQEEMRVALQPARLADGSQPHWPEAPGDDNLNPGKPASYGFGRAGHIERLKDAIVKELGEGNSTDSPDNQPQ
jgi:hypothetical protein